MFDPFFDFMAGVLSWFYELWPSYGMAIIFLTLAILLLVTPLTLKGTRSMLELQIHQPELRRIQTEFRDDRQRMNEELMKFYAEHKINPLGGCLPLLIQMPVFLVLYNVIRGLTRRTDLLGAALSGDSSLAGTFDPKYLDQSGALYEALHQSREMVSWGVDLSRSAVQAVGDGLGTALPYVLLILAATFTSYYQQAQIQRRSTTAINPQMQMITRILPLFITFISLTLPAALVVYFVASGAYRIGQQAIITRHIYDPNKERLQAASAATKAVTTTGREADEPKGFFGKLMAGMNPPDPAGARAAAKGSKGDTDGGGATPGRSSGASSNGSARPSTPRPSGRVTPAGTSSAANRKRKKRK